MPVMVLGVALLAYCPLDPIASLRDTTSIRLPLWYAGWRRMAALSARTNTSWPLPLTPQDWAPTPLAVQASVRALRDAVQQLHDGVETLAARRQQTSTTASRPPSLDAPDKQPRRRPTAATPRNAGGQPGPPGHRQGRFPPPTVRAVRPARCAGGNTTLPLLRPYATQQVLAVPPIAMAVTHWGLHRGGCPECGGGQTAQVPTAQATGYGPRFSARMGEVAGTAGNGRRMVPTCWASVLRVPLSLGALQKGNGSPSL
jgi:transposase